MDSFFQMKDWLHYMPAVLGDANFTTYDFMTSPLFHHFQFWPRACTSKDPTVLCEARDYLVNGKGLVWQLSAFFGRPEGVSSKRWFVPMLRPLFTAMWSDA